MRIVCALIAVLGCVDPTLSAARSLDTARAPFYTREPAREPRPLSVAPAEFEPARGVSWDGRIGWKTDERVWVFAAALESSLKETVRSDSPFRLSVTVVRAERRTGTFVVEFSILDPTGESVEAVQVQGVLPRDRSVDEVYPALAGEMVARFRKSVLSRDEPPAP